MHIQPYEPHQREAVVHFALEAWAPVFDSLQAALNPAVYHEFYPDWRVAQRAAIEEVLASPEIHTWVAVEDAAPVGFVSVKYTPGEVMGEVYMVAVDPGSPAARRGRGADATRARLADGGRRVGGDGRDGRRPRPRAGAPHL